MRERSKPEPFHLLILTTVFSVMANLATAKPNNEFADSLNPSRKAQWEPPNAECKKFISALPPDWTWGVVSNSGVRIFYYFKGSPNELTHPVAILNGGPGRNSHSLPNHFGATPGLNFIYMDQRGTGCSDPFPTVGIHDTSLSELQNWTTRKMVGDFEAVRRHLLQNRKWVIYGHSFGGMAVIRYMEIKPENLVAAHISATSDSFWEPRVTVQAREEAFEILQPRFLDRQLNGPDGPESVRAALLALRRDLPSDMCFIFGDPYENQLCGGEVLDALSLSIGFLDRWDAEVFRIELLRKKLKAGDTRVVQRLLQQLAQEAGVKTEYRNLVGKGAIGFVDMLQGRFISALCEELNLPARNYPISECRMFRNLARKTSQTAYADARRFLRPDPYPQKKIRSNIERLKLPVHVYAGTIDPFVPVVTSQRLAHELGPRVKFHLLQDADHGVAMKHAEVLKGLEHSF